MSAGADTMTVPQNRLRWSTSDRSEDGRVLVVLELGRHPHVNGGVEKACPCFPGAAAGELRRRDAAVG